MDRCKIGSGSDLYCYNTACQKGGKQGHVTSTLFRKCAVTHVHSPHKEMKSNLVNLVVHKESAAQRLYHLQENQEVCPQAATNLPSIMRIPKTKKASSQDTSAADAIPDDVIPETDNNRPYTVAEGPTERISWEEAEARPLREVFAQNIEWKSVTTAIVGQKIQGHPTLHFLDPKKVCDRICSKWRFNDNGPANN